MAIYVPQSILGDILFLPCLFVCSLVCLFASHFYIYHNLCNIKDSNLIFGMHVFLMELHILSGERSRSKSSFKVKGQGQRSNLAILKIATWYLACMCTSWSCTFWVVKGQGHPSMSKVKFKGHIYEGGCTKCFTNTSCFSWNQKKALNSEMAVRHRVCYYFIRLFLLFHVIWVFLMFLVSYVC